jgi:hypothetical protein
VVWPVNLPTPVASLNSSFGSLLLPDSLQPKNWVEFYEIGRGTELAMIVVEEPHTCDADQIWFVVSRIS